MIKANRLASPAWRKRDPVHGTRHATKPRPVCGSRQRHPATRDPLVATPYPRETRHTGALACCGDPIWGQGLHSCFSGRRRRAARDRALNSRMLGKPKDTERNVGRPLLFGLVRGGLMVVA